MSRASDFCERERQDCARERDEALRHEEQIQVPSAADLEISHEELEEMFNKADGNDVVR